MKRCDWPKDDPLYLDYHDKEWGVPLYDDDKLFEMLILEGMQAGLSWITVLRKRENFRAALDNFDPEKISKYTDKKLNQLLKNPGIIRNERKIFACRQNAKAFLEVKKEFNNFYSYIWQFVSGKPIQNRWKNRIEVPVSSKESDAMSKDLKKRGFSFVGTTICYAYMQAVGMVNDHFSYCYRHKEIRDLIASH